VTGATGRCDDLPDHVGQHWRNAITTLHWVMLLARCANLAEMFATSQGGTMTVDHAHAQAGTQAGAGVRLCDRCGRPLPAVDKTEYTPQRAQLVAEAGFCVCPAGAGGPATIPDRAPSLL
jgi:cytochrome b561